MNFANIEFWIFFVAVFSTYWLLPHKAQNRFLLAASYAFYAAWDWRFLGLIAFSTIVDYIVGAQLHQNRTSLNRQKLLAISVSVNMGLLAVFKYFNFFADSFVDLLNEFGMSADPVTLKIILPVGISFYTFQTMSYTIDIYKKKLKPTENFFDFALFVAFFPQLVAGPIERARNLLPNITHKRIVNIEAFSRGVVLCILGLLKKVVIADGVAVSVNSIYGSPNPSGADVLIATYLFAIQIYCDFSGYSDIARGISKMMGFNLMRNFRQPYFATNPQEFWQRWHISLSTWLRDYLYISLGGSHKGTVKTYRNLMITMALGGLWHGAAWNYILWGIYQGTLLCIHRMYSSFIRLPYRPPMAYQRIINFLKIIFFLHFVLYGWLLFRANSFLQIQLFSEKLFLIQLNQFSHLSIPTPPIAVFIGLGLLALWELLDEWHDNPKFYISWPTPVRAALYGSIIYTIGMGASQTTSDFIYFQF